MEDHDHGIDRTGQDRLLTRQGRAGAVLLVSNLGLLSCRISDCTGIFKIGDKISFHECEESTPWEYALEPQGSRFCAQVLQKLPRTCPIAHSSDDSSRASEQGVHS